VMTTKEDQTKDFVDRLAKARSREILPNPCVGILILTFISDTRSDWHQPGSGEDILEVSPRAMRGVWDFTEFSYAHRRIRCH